MSDKHETKDGDHRQDRRRGWEPLPWAKFHWADHLSTPAVRLLTYEQRGRFMDVWASTHGTRTPGVMTEDEARLWAGYTPEEWKPNRAAFARVFNTTRRKGHWILEEVEREHRASLQGFRSRQARARKAVTSRSRKRSSDNEKTTSAPLQVELGVHLGDVQRQDFQRGREQITDVPRGQPSADGTGGTAAGAGALLDDALRASGTVGTTPAQDGAA